jgi:2-polyprenyl-3-methyl-5-hydroxy-6-metoxy-1,4-benzoquinol methylase
MNTHLNSYIKNYTDFNSWLIRKRYEHLSQYFTGTSCLEIGCGDGSGTIILNNHFLDLTVADGSSTALYNIGTILPKVKRHFLDFEQLSLSNKYDTIVLAHVLEHVNNPQIVLEKAKEHLAPGGVLIVDVPNADSLHRQVGVEMGLLNHVTDLNETDISIGHRRVYTQYEFYEEIKKLKMNIKDFGGMFIKVLSNSQTEEVFNEDQLNALFQVGVDNPSIAAELYTVLK